MTKWFLRMRLGRILLVPVCLFAILMTTAIPALAASSDQQRLQEHKYDRQPGYSDSRGSDQHHDKAGYSDSQGSGHQNNREFDGHGDQPGHADDKRTIVPAPKRPGVTCYNQAERIGPYVIRPTDFVIVHTYITTPYCRDINFKATRQAGPTMARVIFKDRQTGRVKGYGAWKRIAHANTWYVLATNVLNYTHYTLEFKVPYRGTTFSGLLAG